jgi:hypothetical protein
MPLFLEQTSPGNVFWAPAFTFGWVDAPGSIFAGALSHSSKGFCQSSGTAGKCEFEQFLSTSLLKPGPLNKKRQSSNNSVTILFLL